MIRPPIERFLVPLAALGLSALALAGIANGREVKTPSSAAPAATTGPVIRLFFTGLVLIENDPKTPGTLTVYIPDLEDVPNKSVMVHRAFIRSLREPLQQAAEKNYNFFGDCSQSGATNEYTWVGLWKKDLQDNAGGDNLTVKDLQDHSVGMSELVNNSQLKKKLIWAATYASTKGSLEMFCEDNKSWTWTLKNTAKGDITRHLAEAFVLTKKLPPATPPATTQKYILSTRAGPFLTYEVANGEVLDILFGNAVPDDVECKGKGMQGQKDEHFARYYELLQSASHQAVPQDPTPFVCPKRTPVARTVLRYPGGSNCPPMHRP
jgi:hypothetical protein